MKKFQGYDKAKEAAQRQGGGRLPKGAYVCKILGVKYEEGKGGTNDFIKVQFDVTEGEYAGFFKKQYEENTSDDKKFKGQTTIWVPADDGSEKDGYTKNTFAKWTNAFEESNEGYSWDWDEKKWKDKAVGIVFGETGTVIEGKEIVYTDARYPVAVEKVRSGKAGEAKFKAKNGYTGKGGSADSKANDFVNLPEGIDEELPF